METNFISLISSIRYQNNFEIKSDGIYQLKDFQSLYDKEFIRSAYLAILRREPDIQGMGYYLNLIRKGISKSLILHQIKKSPEAKKFKTTIVGLEISVMVEKALTLPLIGTVLFAIIFLLNIKNHLQDLRALENHIIRVAQETQVTYQNDIKNISAMLEGIKSK